MTGVFAHRHELLNFRPVYFLGVNEDDEDDVSSLWEEVRGDRPPPPPPAPPKAKASPGGRRRRQERPSAPETWLFAFAADDNEEDITVVFTPLTYWQREGAAYDQELPEEIKTALPGYLDEVMESTYVVVTEEGAPNLTVADIREDLRRNGFRENSAFTDWVQGAALLDDS